MFNTIEKLDMVSLLLFCIFYPVFCCRFQAVHIGMPAEFAMGRAAPRWCKNGATAAKRLKSLGFLGVSGPSLVHHNILSTHEAGLATAYQQAMTAPEKRIIVLFSRAGAC
jgi:hypothetical protein